MSFASPPSIPSLYGTAEVCSTESEAKKSVSGKASPKDGPVSDYIRRRFARASCRRRLQLQKYVRLKHRLNTTMPSVAASRKGLSSRKEFKLLSQWNKLLHNPLKSQSIALKRLYLLFPFHLLEKTLRFPFPFPFLLPSLVSPQSSGFSSSSNSSSRPQPSCHRT
jgi:hypothetical protein